LNAALTRHTGDGGADIIVRDDFGQIIYLIQCKHTTKIDVPSTQVFLMMLGAFCEKPGKRQRGRDWSDERKGVCTRVIDEFKG